MAVVPRSFLERTRANSTQLREPVSRNFDSYRSTYSWSAVTCHRFVPWRLDAAFTPQTSFSSSTSCLMTSYKFTASLREVCRVEGTERIRTMVSLSCRRMEISSPTLTACAGFARAPFTETRPASQSFCANDRREQRRLALRKRSRRTFEPAVGGSRISSRTQEQ